MAEGSFSLCREKHEAVLSQVQSLERGLRDARSQVSVPPPSVGPHTSPGSAAGASGCLGLGAVQGAASIHPAGRSGQQASPSGSLGP